MRYKRGKRHKGERGSYPNDVRKEEKGGRTGKGARRSGGGRGGRWGKGERRGGGRKEKGRRKG